MSNSSVLARTFKLTKKTKGPYNPELINYVRKLRTEEPRRWTPKAVSKKFNIPEGQVELLTPKYILKEKARTDMLRERRSKKQIEEKAAKNERLLNWWNDQIENIPKYREIRKEYARRKNFVIEEVDVDIWKSSDLRDEKADVSAEQIRIEKRKMFSKKRK